MFTRTLAQLRADVVWLADLPTPSNATFITIADLNTQINKGYYECFRNVLRASGESVFKKTQTITTVASTSLYALSADFYKMSAVEMVLNTTDRVILERFTTAERPYLSSATPGWNGEPFKYCLQGSSTDVGNAGNSNTVVQPQIEFLPIPAQSLTINLYYIFGPTTLVADTDFVAGGFSGFEDYAVLYACMRCAMRQEFDEQARQFEVEMERVKADLIEDSTNRDAFMPPRINMTREVWNPRAARRRW